MTRPRETPRHVAQKAQGGKEENQRPQLARPEAAERAVGPLREQRQDDAGHDREAHTGSKLHVIDPPHERVQPGFLHEQQRLERDDRAGKPIGPGPGEQPRGKNNQGSDLRRPVHILAAGCGVCHRDDRDGAREEHRCRRRQPGLPQPSAEPGQCPEHREGPNPAETGDRPVGMPGPLTLQTDGAPAQRGDQETEDVGGGIMGSGNGLTRAET